MAAKWMRRAVLTAALTSAALLTACGSSSVESAISPNRFVVFGDGMADTGQRGSAYTVNNGTVNNWTTQLAARYDIASTPASKGGWNYAYGNARISQSPDAAGATDTPTVVQQVDKFLAGNAFTNDDIVVVSAGVSDVIANTRAFLAGSISRDQLMANAAQAGADLAAQVHRVIKAGAKHVVVTGTYDLRRTPWAKSIDQEVLLEQVALAMNNRLKIDIEPLGGRQVLYIDAAYQVNMFHAYPSQYGFREVEQPICTSVDSGPGIGIGNNEVNSALCTGNTLLAGAEVNRYVFADKIYITPEAHRRLGDYARDIIVQQW